jgi:predicted solute-binding protein
MIDQADLQNARIAIPGRYTTANLLFTIAWPEAGNKTEYLFSDIEEALLREGSMRLISMNQIYGMVGFKIADLENT